MDMRTLALFGLSFFNSAHGGLGNANFARSVGSPSAAECAPALVNYDTIQADEGLCGEVFKVQKSHT